MKRITVRYFASVREVIGVTEEVLQTNAHDVAALRLELMLHSSAHAQGLKQGNAIRAALNHVACDGTTSLNTGDELAFFPPVTGG